MNIGNIILISIIATMIAMLIIAIIAFIIDIMQDIRLRKFINKKNDKKL